MPRQKPSQTRPPINHLAATRSVLLITKPKTLAIATMQNNAINPMNFGWRARYAVMVAQGMPQ